MTEKGILHEIDICENWLEYYEDRHNSFAFDEWWCKRERLKADLKKLRETTDKNQLIEDYLYNGY